MDSKIDLGSVERCEVQTSVSINPVDATPTEEIALEMLPTLPNTPPPGVTTFSAENLPVPSPRLLALRAAASYAAFFVAGYK